MGKHDLAGNYLDGNGNVDLSQKRPKSQLPWFYRGKSTAVKLPRCPGGNGATIRPPAASRTSLTISRAVEALDHGFDRQGPDLS